MTEQEWIHCPGLYRMLEFLGNGITARKLRLFGCACCRRIWHLLSDQRSRDALEIAERFADGLATRQEMDEAYAPARMVVEDTLVFSDPDQPWINNYFAGYHAALAAMCLVSGDIASWEASTEATKGVRGAVQRKGNQDVVSMERYQQAVLLRDIAGNPFRALPTIDPAILAWKDGTVRRLAQVIYDERAFLDMPVLADALEEAGCQDSTILDHLRGPGPHVRGCGPLDLLLGKE